METIPLIDLEMMARHLKLPLPGVQNTAELLEEGNTVPFITRFRKDQTGGLDEQQVRMIEGELKRAKLLAERKETILKSIESRGKLNSKLSSQIAGTKTISELEDVYLPYKPKKQSLASLARSRGLEPLATAVLEAKSDSPSVEELAAGYVDESKSLPNVDAVMEGLKHLLAEHFGNHRQLRSKLRKHLSKQGKLVSKKIDEPVEQPEKADANAPEGNSDGDAAAPSEPKPAPVAEGDDAKTPDAKPEVKVVEGSAPAATTDSGEVKAGEESASDTAASDTAAAQESTADETVPTAEASSEGAAETKTEGAADSETAEASVSTEASSTDSPSAEAGASDSGANEAGSTDANASNDAPEEAVAEATSGTEATPVKEATPAKEAKVPKQSVAKSKKTLDAIARRDQRRETRRRRRDRLVQSFKDYFDFSDPIGRIPHHRILAINRGERTKVLRVKIECSDWDRIQAEAASTAIPAEHPMADFLRVCLQDAMGRLLQPSIEREVRRQLTDRAEEHAVTVFARNLRKLLLQPPLRQHRVVAIDPGFRSGCKLVAVDEFGQMLGHTFINLLGKEQQKQNGRAGLAQFVQEHKATVIAVGNGAACRETETLVAEVLSNELKDQDIGYLIVNEAGTSVYSTSELGREELPNVDATVRSAVSIGRRSLDPLSELVKIDPASIGVGLYQHDVKAKHLRESLDDVVESCVNFVGVNVNSASPALLRRVSGLNALKARKIYEHRQANGPFRNREQIKEVSGVGEASYVQAAGFLKIVDGDNPLDGTWIHPESYPAAMKVLEAIGFNVEDLRQTTCAKPEDTRAEVPEFGAGVELPTESDSAADDAAKAATTESTTDESATSEAVPTDAPTEAVVDVPAEAVADAPAETVVDAPAEAVADAPAEPESASGGAAAAESTDKVSPVAKVEAAPAEADGTSADATEANASDTTPATEKSERAERFRELTEKIATVDVGQLAPSLGVGKLSLQDILNALARPGRDPREDLPPPIFRTGILKLEDLKPGLELSGTVLNVVDFGAFVDIGLVDSGLIHVSRLADRFISDPHDIVSVGDILRVWVVEVDQKRRRVSLTAIEPGTEKPKTPKSSSGERGNKERSRRSKPDNKERGKNRRFSRGKGQKPKEFKPKAKPKPVVPITKEMEEGKEPMRTFGDLKQLFEKKKRGGSR